MGKTLEEISQMAVSEFLEWQAYYEREAFGHDIDRLQGGVIASTIANVNRDPQKRPFAYKPQDFTIAPPAPVYESPFLISRKLRRKAKKCR